MFSYWEQKYFSTYDTVIVGAGLAGLFIAINLKKKFPKQSVLVLDKEMFPAASTKNAGFACMGSLTELEDDLNTNTADEIATLFEKRYKGLQIMRNELSDDAIDYNEQGSYELLYKKDEDVLNKMSFWNERLFSVAYKNSFTIEQGLNKSFVGFSAMLKNELEGEIDTGKMYLNLKKKAQSLGVEIRMNLSVKSFEKSGSQYFIQAQNDFIFKSDRLIFCTNAFTKQLLPSVEIKPARGQVILAKPNDNISFKGIYHFDRGYYYFREVDGLVLFGGGRNLDVEIETTDKLGVNEFILKDLKTKLSEQILPNHNFEIINSWSGIMGNSSSKEPIAEQLDENLFLLAGFGGMGVALAPFMAKSLVNEIN